MDGLPVARGHRDAGSRGMAVSIPYADIIAFLERCGVDTKNAYRVRLTFTPLRLEVTEDAYATEDGHAVPNWTEDNLRRKHRKYVLRIDQGAA